jgi:hypothetical protein
MASNPSRAAWCTLLAAGFLFGATVLAQTPWLKEAKDVMGITLGDTPDKYRCETAKDPRAICISHISAFANGHGGGIATLTNLSFSDLSLHATAVIYMDRIATINVSMPPDHYGAFLQTLIERHGPPTRSYTYIDKPRLIWQGKNVLIDAMGAFPPLSNGRKVETASVTFSRARPFDQPAQ